MYTNLRTLCSRVVAGGRRLGGDLARRLLRASGVGDVDEVLHDLAEERRGRRARGAGAVRLFGWQAREVIVVAAYQVRDGGGRHRKLFPLLALRLAATNLRRRPAVPILAALTLALGYGAAAAIFGVYAGFGRALPVPDGDQVHWVRVLDERGRVVGLTHADLEAVDARTRSFASLGGFSETRVSVRVPGGYAVPAAAASMSPAVFDLLRTRPALGRFPAGVEDAEGVVLSDELWARHFDADPGVVGTRTRVEGVERIVLGVMPPGYRFPFNQDLWSVTLPSAESVPVSLAARLADGVSAIQAAADVERILEARREAAGVEDPRLRVEVPRFTEKRGEGGENAILATLLALAVSLLLVSCSNVSNMLLGRALARSDLLAVHAAIGAGPSQVVLQLFCEALLIAASGALVGLAIAAGAIHYIEATLGGHWGYYWMRVQFEPAVVLFTLGLAALTGILSGMVPAFRLGRLDLADVLRSDAAGVVGVRRGGLSRWLLNGQVMFSCLALIIAILMSRALLSSRPAPEFRASEIFAVSVALDGAAYEAPTDRRELRNALVDDVAADPRVAALVATNVLPGLENVGDAPEVEGVELDPDARRERAVVLVVTPGFFDMLDIRLLSGRGLSPTDGERERVAVVSAGFVREFLGAGDAVGRRVRLPDVGGEEWITIIGVVGDFAAYDSADSRDRGRIYLPFTAQEPRTYHLLFTGPSGAAASGAVRGILADLDPDLGVGGAFGSESMASVADILSFVAQLYITAGILATLGGIGAALVALVGLYGSLSFEVQRRRGEIGVRMAMGAARSDVLRHVTRTGLRSVAPGLVVGFLMSAGFSPALGVLLGRTSPRDPFVYMGVFAAYVLVAVVATLVPGRRAAGLDPVRVLRSD